MPLQAIVVDKRDAARQHLLVRIIEFAHRDGSAIIATHDLDDIKQLAAGLRDVRVVSI